MGRGVGDKKKWSKSKTGRIFEIATKNKNFNSFFRFFWCGFFRTRNLAESWLPPPPPLVVGQARGGCAPNSKISFLRRFRELRGCIYHFYHQNHGGDGCRARYFGPTGPGCGDMPNFGAKILNYNFPGQKGPKWAIFGCILGISPPGGLKMGQKVG